MVQEADILGEKYRLEARIAEGGMGAVWRARHITLGHVVAIKILPPGSRGSDGAVERFLQEARIIAGIRHRNVIGIVDFGTAEGNRPYIVMEHLDGEPLSERLRRGPDLGWNEVVAILSDVLSGLASVHSTGILHGDVKPENVFLATDADGTVSAKLIDFGVSRSIQEGDGAVRLAGTPPYMAPEQLQRDGVVDTRADLYAVGVIAYEIFGGVSPYSGRDVSEIIAATVRGGAKPVRERRPELNEQLALFIDRSISTVASKRFFAAKEMRAALLEIAATISPEFAIADRVTPTFGLKTSPHIGGVARARADAPTPPEPLYSSPALDALAPLVSEATQQIDHRTMVMQMPKRKKRSVLPFVGAGVAIVAISAAAGILLKAPNPRAEETTAARSVTATAAAAAATRPAALAEPIVAAPAPATVALNGVPDDAVVYVDNARTTLADGRLSFERDGHVHAIEVRAPGRVSWRVGYLARTNASYHVVLEEVGAPEAAPATEPAAARPTAEAARRPAKRANDTSSLTRDPGF